MPKRCSALPLITTYLEFGVAGLYAGFSEPSPNPADPFPEPRYP